MSVPTALRCGITNHATYYDYRVMYGPCADLDEPTLSELLDDVRSDHAKSCRCGVEVLARAWKSSYTTEDSEDTRNLDASLLTEYKLSTPLSEFFEYVEDTCAVMHIFFEGKRSEHAIEDDPYALPALFSHYSGSVCRVGGGPSRLATDANVTYDLMADMSGMLIVDKSKYVQPKYSQQKPWRLPVLRRPQGFGKTMFLSMLETWFDLDRGSDSAWFPSTNDPYMPPEWRHCCRNPPSLVCHLDLSGLSFSEEGNEDVLQDTCREFLNAAARDCFRRYRHRLKYPVSMFYHMDVHIILPPDSMFKTFEQMSDVEIEKISEEMTFERLLRLVSLQEYPFPASLFVGVDNYTAPLKDTGKSPLLELIIVTEIFEPIIRGLRSGPVYRAFMVGDSDLPGEPFMPYCVTPFFYEYSCDLTDSHMLYGALGLREPEIVALGQALFDDKTLLLRHIRERAGLGVLVDDPVGDWVLLSRTYSYRDVFAVAHALGSGHGAVPSSLTITSIDYNDCRGFCPYRSLPEEIAFYDLRHAALAKAARDKSVQNDNDNDNGDNAQPVTSPTPSSKSSAKRKERVDDADSFDEDRDERRTPST